MIIVKQAGQEWYIKLYNEKWLLRDSDWKAIKETIYKNVGVVDTVGVYKEMPSMEIPINNVEELKTVFDLILKYKIAFGQSDFKMIKRNEFRRKKKNNVIVGGEGV